jgi:hypothetical protein
MHDFFTLCKRSTTSDARNPKVSNANLSLIHKKIDKYMSLVIIIYYKNRALHICLSLINKLNLSSLFISSKYKFK